MIPPMPTEPSRRDLRLILAIQGLRAFLYGWGSVTIGAVLAARGLSAGAVGALAAGGPAAFRHLFPGLPADQRFLLVFPVLALACSMLASRLSAAVERSTSGSRPAGSPMRRPPMRSRGIIRRLAALFAL